MSHGPQDQSDVIALKDADPGLYNHELAPLKKQTWTSYNIFCYWMSDVHSVGGYIFAGSLFALGLTSWQVLVSLVAGIMMHGFAGLSTIGWVAFMIMWVLQALVFWNGMESIKKFIDFAGPAVYVVMFILAGWMLWKSGGNLSLKLSDKELDSWGVVTTMITAMALVAGYFAGPVLNFGDFSRYAKSFDEVKRGNFLGLPINYLAFSIVTVVTTAATVPVFGALITDPVEMVGRMDSPTVVFIGAVTFVIATIGINIVANFVPSAFDFTNLAPSRISWRMGGMLAAIGSIFVTPWNLFKNPEMIHYTIEMLACAIGPLYGILLVDYYLVKKRSVTVPDLYTMSPQGRYWYQNGVILKAVYALIPASLIGFANAMLPAFAPLAHFSIFIAGGVAGLIYLAIARVPAVAPAQQQAPAGG